MSDKPLKFLIIDGYSKKSRDDLEMAGMSFAWKLYENMVLRYLPGAQFEVCLPSDEGTKMPDEASLKNFNGIIWTGCNLSVNDLDNPSVVDQIELAKIAYQLGIPSWGSCWGLQIAVVAAGGKVIENPKGREMGMARKVLLTPEAENHPMYEGKSKAFDAFISHDDMVTSIPEGGTILAGNDFTRIQAMEVKHKKGVFWAVQYHPEYNLSEMASLMIAREEKLTDIGFFKDHNDFVSYVKQLKELAQNPESKSLRWQLAIDDDVLDESIRGREFENWINNQILS